MQILALQPILGGATLPGRTVRRILGHKHLFGTTSTTLPLPTAALLAHRLRRQPATPVNRWIERRRAGLGYGLEEYRLDQQVASRANAVAAEHLPRTWRLEGGLELSEHRIWLDALPEEFRAFRIAHLTDIHHSTFHPLRAVSDVVELVNELQPDLVALTGDFVTYSRVFIEPVAHILGRLRARNGVFAVLGNHDFRVGPDHVTRALEREGISVLRNTHTRLHRFGASLHLAGIDDYRYEADLSRALRGIPSQSRRDGNGRLSPTVLLSHNPAIIGRAAARGVGFVLSGHTHGGQVRLPLLGTIYGHSPDRMRFKVGWDRLGPTQIYVSRGLGTVVLPVRFGCPAELAQFHLESCGDDASPPLPGD